MQDKKNFLKNKLTNKNKGLRFTCNIRKEDYIDLLHQH
jgi:hypothetical protein